MFGDQALHTEEDLNLAFHTYGLITTVARKMTSSFPEFDRMYR